MKSYDQCFYVIETDEENPKAIAVLGSLPAHVADGYRVRAEFYADMFALGPYFAKSLLDGEADNAVNKYNKERKPNVFADAL